MVQASNRDGSAFAAIAIIILLLRFFDTQASHRL